MANLTVHTLYPRIKPTLTSKRRKTGEWHFFSSIADDIKAGLRKWFMHSPNTTQPNQIIDNSLNSLV